MTFFSGTLNRDDLYEFEEEIYANDIAYGLRCFCWLFGQ